MTDLSARFWDKWADRYAKKPVADLTAYEKKLTTTQRYLSADDTVLELGCGTGTTALVHAARVKNIVGIDFSKRMIEIAQRKASDQGIANASFKCLPADQEWQQKFDAVLALSLLHLVEQPEGLTQRIFDALAPGGVFIQNTPVLADTKPWLKPLFRFANLFRLLPKIHLLSRSSLIDDLEQTGFTVEHEWFHESADALFIVAKKPLADLHASTPITGSQP